MSWPEIFWVSFMILVRVLLALCFLSQYGEINNHANRGSVTGTIAVSVKAIIFLALFIWSCTSVTLF